MIFESIIIGVAIVMGFVIAAKIIAVKAQFFIIKNETSSGGKTFFGANADIVREALAHEEREDIRREEAWERRTRSC